ncbi:MAG: hypothetical protein ABW196_01650 [Solirubrobacterales bacterium]
MKRGLLCVSLTAAALLSIPSSAAAAEYDTFVGCDDLSENPVPAHVCQIGDFPGAYFESDEDTEYEICVAFPTEEVLCLEEQLAEGGILFVNSITSELEGNHVVSWFVEGVEIGSWSFRMDAPPPPPPPPPPVTSAPAPPAPPVVTSSKPSVACSKAKQRVGQLKSRLRKAASRKQRARIRPKLKAARATVKSAC